MEENEGRTVKPLLQSSNPTWSIYHVYHVCLSIQVVHFVDHRHQTWPQSESKGGKEGLPKTLPCRQQTLQIARFTIRPKSRPLCIHQHHQTWPQGEKRAEKKGFATCKKRSCFQPSRPNRVIMKVKMCLFNIQRWPLWWMLMVEHITKNWVRQPYSQEGLDDLHFLIINNWNYEKSETIDFVKTLCRDKMCLTFLTRSHGKPSIIVFISKIGVFIPFAFTRHTFHTALVNAWTVLTQF